MTRIIRVSEAGAFEILSVVTGSIITLVFGTWIPLMTTLLILNVVDVFTGVLKGSFRHEIGSKQFYAGIKRKVGHWVLIIVGNSVDVVAFESLPVAKTLVVSFLVGTEGISIIENLAIMGVPIPHFITKYLVQIKEASGNGEMVNLPDVTIETVETTETKITIDKED